MANELFTAVKITARKGGANLVVDSSVSQDMTGSEIVQTTQSIGTSAETVSLGEISGAPKQVLIKNLDVTNFVEIGGDSGLTVFKLKILPGCSNLISPSSATIYAKADTAAVRILVAAASA